MPPSASPGGPSGPGWAGSRAGRLRTVALAGLLMTCWTSSSIRWRCGASAGSSAIVFFYPEGGLYFGVPLSNFVGWLPGRLGHGRRATSAWPGTRRLGSPRLGIALYYVVLAVNLAVTLWIGELLIAAAGIVVQSAVFLLLYNVSRVSLGRWSAGRLSVTS